MNNQNPTPRMVLDTLLEAKELTGEARTVLLSRSFPEGDADFFEAAQCLFDEHPLTGIRIRDHFKVGQDLGPYHIEKVIGEGGMGRVYLARDKNQPELKVALKTIHPNYLSSTFLARFERERQILARLNHPNIASLYSVSSKRSEIPFLAMEYVEGTTIDHYCGGTKIGLDQFLDLFDEICDALEFAHQNLVIHRDIKPSNVLVNQRGRVKLLDFGIAGLIDEETKKQAQVTQVGPRLMSPDYAAPEQLGGLPLSTASDVFMLGTLLYKLLTGRLPYAEEGTAAVKRYQRITEEHFEPPSRLLKEHKGISAAPRITQEVFRLPKARLRDLDAILAKALKPDPANRYQSVERFANDLKAWRQYGFLSIDTPNRFGVLQRYMQRNRKLVLGSLGFCLLMAGFSTYLVHQSQELQMERDTAKREQIAAQRVTQFMVDMFEGNEGTNNLQHEITARELLDQGALSIETELADKPMLKARLQHAMGRAYLSLAQTESALPLLKATLTYMQETKAPPEQIFTVEEDINELMLNQGHFQEVEARLNRMIKTAETLREQHPHLYLQAHNDLAEAYLYQGKFERAEQELIHVLGQSDFEKADPLLRASLFNNLGLLYRAQSKYPQALVHFENTLQALREEYKGVHREIAKALNNIGVIHSNLGNLKKAEEHYLKALAMHPEVYGENHGETGKLKANLAVLYHNQNQLEKAVEYYLAARTQLLQFFPASHPNVAQNHLSMSSAFLSLGQPEEAEKYVRIALTDMLGQADASPAILAQGYLRLAIVLIPRGELDEAEDLLQRHLTTLPKEIGPDHPSRANNILHRGRICNMRGQTEEAIAKLHEAEQIYLKRVPESHRWVQRTRIYKAQVWRDAEAYQKAEVILLGVRDAIIQGGLEGTQIHFECLEDLAKLYHRQKRVGKAAGIEKQLASLNKPG
ncbi:serine/threonine-protein kinase [Acanthopleuribacter pedis]|uniref:Serine/threonine protein kinase n=1 Tax=Acanthopleuribacter pedis TaxID=442870 RepID=A0A8J7U3L6_9BACT|nr:serine/threonine-protein kinase [Acanthopleuribacter pedis]MBO1320553.1 serine/threonine protein kinase [Acanthopleuribacter pedis]